MKTGDGYWHRVANAFSWNRGAIVVAITLVASAQILAQPMDVDFWSFRDIARAWITYTTELLMIAVLIAFAFTLTDEALPSNGLWRWVAVALVIVVASAVGTYIALRFESFGPAPPLEVIAGESLRWSILGVFFAVLVALHRRVSRAQAEVQTADQARVSLAREEAEQQLQLLQAQIEPHFLFNTLANVRRLYRTQPETGAQMIESFKRYLGAALPRIREGGATLANELELVRAYLELFEVRLGKRLIFEIKSDPRLRSLPIPPLLLMTLVENAVKHGIAPTASGGRIDVVARTSNGFAQLEVTDDGVGFAFAPTSGTGVGLVNVRRQLAARYGVKASLSVEQRDPRGVKATLHIPLDRTLSSRTSEPQHPRS